MNNRAAVNMGQAVGDLLENELAILFAQPAPFLDQFQ